MPGPAFSMRRRVVEPAAVVGLAFALAGSTTLPDVWTDEPQRLSWTADSAVVDVVVPGLEVGRPDTTPVRKKGLTLGKREPDAVAAPVNDFGVPLPAMRAYRDAAETLADRTPGCDLSWSLLAGIGVVETNHGRFGGAVLTAAGTSSPRILGPVLDGTGDFAAISDSDRGRLDGNKHWDRAVGPMQFIPQTWASMGADGDRDGRKDPHDLDDAALAAGKYLCAGGGSLHDSSSLQAAVLSYNHSLEYSVYVRSYAESYARGEYPSLSAEAIQQLERLRRVDEKQGKHKKKTKQLQPKQHRDRPDRDRDGLAHRPKPDRDPDPAPKPEPDPEPKPGPDKDPKPKVRTRTVSLQGDLAPCDDGWCVGGTYAGRLAGLAPADDYDGDCKQESMYAELKGVADEGATVLVSVRQTLVDGEVRRTEALGFEMVTELVCEPDDPTPTTPTPTD